MLQVPKNIIEMLKSMSGKNIRIAQECENLKKKAVIKEYKIWEYAIIIRNECGDEGSFIRDDAPSDDPERVICKG